MKTFSYLCILIALSACSSSSNHAENLKEGELLSLDVTHLSDEIHTVKFSELMESVEIIQLDTASEAYMAKSMMIVSDHYLLITNVRESVKLFRRSDGKYLNDIAQRGQGPGEFLLVQGGIIDEQNGRIYLIDAIQDYLMAYDLTGKHLPEENIPLPTSLTWGNIYLNNDSILAFITPTDAGTTIKLGQRVEQDANKYLGWVQDLKGNVSKSIPAERVIMPIEKSLQNRLFVFHLADSPIYTYTIDQRDVFQADTLYHYNIKKHRFYPAYTNNLTHNDYSLVKNTESPLHYYTTHHIYKEGTAKNKSNIKKLRMIQVDKQTGHARYIRLVNDLMDGREVYPLFFQKWMEDNGLVINYISDVLTLKEDLEEALATRTNIETSLRERLTKLKDSLNEDSNDVIFIYKFKTAKAE